MATRSLFMSAALSLAAGAVVVTGGQQFTSQARGDEVAPDVQNSKFQFEGAINTNNVYVRSGPAEGFYPTIKLDKGATVTVVGIKFDWLKILPPDGSFCYVSKLYVEKRGDGSVGRVTKPDLNVRAGSTLNGMKTTVQTRLNAGDDVQILGEQDEYFKIKPPAGAFVYVNKQFVDPVRAIAAPVAAAAEGGPKAARADAVEAGAGEGAAAAAGILAASTGGAATAGNPSTAGVNAAPSIDGAAAGTTAPAAPAPTAAAPTNGAAVSATATPSTTQPSPAVAAAPATQPVDPVTKAETDFAAAEATFNGLNGQPLDQQPVEELKAKYESLAKGKLLSEDATRVCDLRTKILAIRVDSKARLLEVRKLQREAGERALALQAEHQELEERLKSNDIQVYAAVGTLQPSSLQQGASTLYRLTDPGTGRTVVYLRTNDAKVVSMLGQFVGVKGETSSDAQLNLKVIAPSDVQPVDPAKLNTTVAAQIIPPSLMAKNISASTGNQ